MSKARDNASYANAAATLNASGLYQVVPTSIVKGASGTASVTSNGAVTFTGTESIALDGCFSSTYANYRVVYDITNASATNTLRMVLRSSGTDTTSEYSFVTYGVRFAAGSAYNSNGNNVSYIDLPQINTTNSDYADWSNASFDVVAPQLLRATSVLGMGTGIMASETSGYGTTFNGIHFTAKVFDGIKIYPSTGNITGTIRVYGYRN